MTPLQKVATVQTMYNDSLSTAIELRRNGIMDDATYKDVEAVRGPAYDAIQTAKTLALAGQTIQFSSFESQLNTEIDKLLAILLRVQAPAMKGQTP